MWHRASSSYLMVRRREADVKLDYASNGCQIVAFYNNSAERFANRFSHLFGRAGTLGLQIRRQRAVFPAPLG